MIVDKHLGQAMDELHVRKHGEIPEDQLPKDRKGKPIRRRFPKTPNEFSEIVLSDAVMGPAEFREKYAALLAAHLADREVDFRVSGCASLSGVNVPTIVDFVVYSSAGAP